MRRIFAGISLVMTLAFAQSVAADNMVEFFDAVLHSTAMKEVLKDKSTLVKSINKTQTYRCIGCYGFDVVTETHDGSGHAPTLMTHSMMTAMDLLTEEITVTRTRR